MTRKLPCRPLQIPGRSSGRPQGIRTGLGLFVAGATVVLTFSWARAPLLALSRAAANLRYSAYAHWTADAAESVPDHLDGERAVTRVPGSSGRDVLLGVDAHGRILAVSSATEPANIIRIEPRTGRRTTLKPGRGDTLLGVDPAYCAVSPDGEKLLWLSGNSPSSTWKITDLREMRTSDSGRDVHESVPPIAAWAPDGRMWVEVARLGPTIAIVRHDGRSVARRVLSVPPHTNVLNVAVDSKRDVLLLIASVGSSWSGDLLVVPARAHGGVRGEARGRRSHLPVPSGASPVSIAILRGGVQVAWLTEKDMQRRRTLTVWTCSFSDPRPQRLGDVTVPYPEYSEQLTRLAGSADGRTLFVGTTDGVYRLGDTMKTQ
jgi:hypothetical protein